MFKVCLLCIFVKLRENNLIRNSFFVYHVYEIEPLSSVGCTWRVQKKISKYGEDLTLLCSSENYIFQSRTWIGGPAHDTISINEKVKDSKKYIATIKREGYVLIIKDVTEYDLNVTYQCSYGICKSDKIMLLQHDAFEGNYVNLLLFLSER